MLKHIVDGDLLAKNSLNIHDNRPGHNRYCRRLRYSNIDDSIKNLEYTLDDDLLLMATGNSSNLSKQKKVKLVKFFQGVDPTKSVFRVKPGYF